MRARNRIVRVSKERTIWGTVLMCADLIAGFQFPFGSFVSSLCVAGAVICFGYAMYWAHRYDTEVSR